MNQRYKELKEIPEDKKEIVKDLLRKGVIDLNEHGQFNISTDMLDLIIILTRLGVM